MRLFTLAFSMVMALALTGCSSKDKKGGCTTPAEDDAKMVKYIADNGINATKHASGLYYQIIDPGTGATPTASSTVKANYNGKFTDNKSFDANVASFPLNRVIKGWQIGIPLIKQGGKIKLIIPPYLGYECDDYNGIPGNSVLVFDVELLEVR
ncbi:peptidylprolyl isomerase [Pseudoflavitalea sp. G-6-1-2]|uniref:FKBP-type peptidyl-prolyl cis-trans isomerase n=1 Tax=Pseudoflavitalea sp. G-6-1-2 TaxID=2728841 RepID=UPI00146E6E6E|nr:FKBP-type peptidyl-prolyl cis-trans isomerase [Pseudoflavitalea sp. G-6-1-2]NML21991.1 peptidylprolyl isomerase [Pseudoflavitalea sp. G-6-1-2]